MNPRSGNIIFNVWDRKLNVIIRQFRHEGDLAHWSRNEFGVDLTRERVSRFDIEIVQGYDFQQPSKEEKIMKKRNDSLNDLLK